MTLTNGKFNNKPMRRTWYYCRYSFCGGSGAGGGGKSSTWKDFATATITTAMLFDDIRGPKEEGLVQAKLPKRQLWTLDFDVDTDC